MSQPNSAKSVTVSLAAGTHWLCTCGRSSNFPHCDGTHQGTSFQPLAFTLDSPKLVEIER